MSVPDVVALLSRSTGVWAVFVPVVDVPSTAWPEYEWPPRVEPPPRGERAEALAALGFALPVGAEWAWQESPGGEDEPVELVATCPVVAVER